MGERPQSDIFYGILLPEEYDLPIELSDALPYDWGTLYLSRSGETLEDDDSFIKHQEEATKRSGCILAGYGSEHASEYFVAIQASHLHGDWDDALELSPTHFLPGANVIAAWQTQLREFCRVLEIPFDFKEHSPKWYCVSSLN